jgi:glucose/arabinose dehydrogenase
MRCLSSQFNPLHLQLDDQQRHLELSYVEQRHLELSSLELNRLVLVKTSPVQFHHRRPVVADRQLSALPTLPITGTAPAKTLGLVFLDVNVTDYATLGATVLPGYQVILIRPGADPIGLISTVLSQHQQLSSMHLVCHGAPGQLNWADRVMDRAAIEHQQFAIQQWSLALAKDATILLYGCEVGSGHAGVKLIQRLSELTGAQVAASSTRVGQAAQGGNWQLDVCTGDANTVPLAFDAATLETYTGILFNPIIQLNNFADSSFFSLNGNARQVGGALQLTDNQTLQRGSSFYVTPLQIDGGTSFSTQFQFSLTGPTRGDGFTFMLQNSAQGVAALGSDGGNLGYGGLEKSVAIKFDTFQNIGLDLSNNFVALVENGDISTTLAQQNASFDLHYGGLVTAWVDYSALSGQLAVYLSQSGAKPGEALFSQAINLAGLVGNAAYVGFSSGTGAASSLATLTNWQLTTQAASASEPPPAVARQTLDLTALLSGDALQLNGSAVAPLNSTLQLTPDRQQQRGSAFAITPIQIADRTSFQTQFQFRIDGLAGTNGGDGFTFVLQNSGEGSATLGGQGGNLGYGGINRSVAIKFDTFKNGTFDLSDNSVGILTDGDITAAIGGSQAAPFDLNNGSLATAWVEYDGIAKALSVFLSQDGVKPGTAVLSQTIDLTAVLGNRAYVGFTGGTGGISSRTTITSWQFAAAPGTPAPGTGDGLRAEYFDNADFTNLKLVRIGDTINFNWLGGSPVPVVEIDTFSVRWTGQVQALYDETYTFYAPTGQRERLLVDGQLLIDTVDNPAGNQFGALQLTAGQLYNLQLEYYDQTGPATISLDWSSLSQVRQVIPQSQLYTVTENRGTIGFGTAFLDLREGTDDAVIEIDRLGGTDGYATVTIAANEATATLGVRYTTPIDFDTLLPSDSVTFKPGETVKKLRVPIINDAIIQPNQYFSLGIADVVGSLLATPRSVRITILDDDGQPTFSFKEKDFTVIENGALAVVIVQRTGDLTQAVSVNYSTANGTAVDGTDYVGAAGVLNFAVNQAQQTFTVQIKDNAIVNPNKTINLTLTALPDSKLGVQKTAVLTILDDDGTGTFKTETFLTGLVKPTAFVWSQDNQYMFVAQKGGIVRAAKNGVLQATPVIDISDDVNEFQDRGMIGIAINPDFANNPYLYLTYTYDPPEAANGVGLAARDAAGNRPSRLVRITVTTDAQGRLVADPNSQLVLLGKNSTWANTSHPEIDSTIDLGTAPSGQNPDGSWIQDYLNTDSVSHSIGMAAFGPDGMLYVSNGDGTSFNAQDNRALRVQDLTSLSGKLLRIDPNTGQGLGDNPFFDGNADSNQSKVYNYGFRNPFRFTFDPVTGFPVIGDVGWNNFEELNTGGPGKNFGWPFYEGGADGANFPTVKYSNLPQAQAYYANPGANLTAPIFTLDHNGGSSAIAVGDFYTGTAYPAIYKNSLFVADLVNGTVQTLTLNATGQVTNARLFPLTAPGAVYFKTGADGDVYFANLYGGKIQRWVPV